MASASEREQPESTIAVRESEATTAVYLEHAGAYWSLGPVFEKVRAYMREQESSGSLYVKYLSDPTRSASGSRAMEVGFLTRGEHEATAPFMARRQEAVMVASTQVPASGFSLHGVCETMNAWIASEGFETIGPVIEIYGSMPGESETNPTIEIQIPVRKPAVKVIDPPQTAPVGPWPDEGHAIVVAAADEVRNDDEVASPVSLDRIEVVTADDQDDPATETAAAFGPSTEVLTEAVVAEEIEPPVPAEWAKREPLSLLYDEGQYARLAHQLVPDAGSLALAQRNWCGHLVSRIKAVGHGVRKVFPDSALGARGLADAIVDRHERTSRAYEVDPLESADARSDPLSDRQAGAKNEIIRKIDRLLWRLSIGKIEADETGSELVRILEEAEGILGSR